MNKLNVLHLFSRGEPSVFLDYFLKEQEALLEHRSFTAEQQTFFFATLDVSKSFKRNNRPWLNSEIYFEHLGRPLPFGLFRLIQFVKKHRIHAITTYGESLGLWVSLMAPLLGNPLLIHFPLAPPRGFFAGWPKAFLSRRVTKRGYVDVPLLRFLQDPEGFEAALHLHPETFQHAGAPRMPSTPDRIVFEMECLYTQTVFWRREKQFLMSTFQQAIPFVRRKFRKSLFRFQKPHRRTAVAETELKVSIFLCQYFPNEKVLYQLFHCLKLGRPFLVFSNEIYPSAWREAFAPLVYPLEKAVCETVLAETITNPTDLFALTEKTKNNLTPPSSFGGFLEKTSYHTLTALEQATQPRLAKLHRSRQIKSTPQVFSDDAFFSLLRCPRCQQTLKPKISHAERKIAWSGSLDCLNCDEQFPLVNGIPQLLIENENGAPGQPPTLTWRLPYQRLSLFSRQELSAFEQSLLKTLIPLATQSAHQAGIGLHLHTGDGVLLENLAFYGGRWLGVDLPGRLQKTQSTLRDFSNVRLIAALPHQVPVTNHSFALAIDVNSLWDVCQTHWINYQKYFERLSASLLPENGQLHLLSFNPPQAPKLLEPYWAHLRYLSEGLPQWMQQTLALGFAAGQNIWDHLQEKPSGRLPLLRALWLGLLQSSEFTLPDEKCFRQLSRQARLNGVELQRETGHLALTARR